MIDLDVVDLDVVDLDVVDLDVVVVVLDFMIMYTIIIKKNRLVTYERKCYNDCHCPFYCHFCDNTIYETIFFI
jgi:hypothetical protein